MCAGPDPRGLGGSFTLHSSRRGEASAAQGAASLPSASVTEAPPRAVVTEPAGVGEIAGDLWLVPRPAKGEMDCSAAGAGLPELCCSDAACELQAAVPTSSVWLMLQVLLSKGIRLCWAPFLGVTSSSLCSAPLVASVSESRSKSRTQITSPGLQEENTLPNATYKGRNLTERSQRSLLKLGFQHSSWRQKVLAPPGGLHNLCRAHKATSAAKWR